MTSDGVSYQKKDGNLTTVKSALDELITKSSKVDKLEKKVTDYEKKVHYLADKVQVGDYVAYDAGEWKESAGQPTQQGQFGGYTQGKNRGESVVCKSTYGSTDLKGWRVLKKENNQVYLVHAGQPECYYHAGGGHSEESVKLLNERAKQYMNSYADSAHAINKQEALDITGSYDTTTEDLRTTGAEYWLATEYDTFSLWYVYSAGDMRRYNGTSLGFRPVIVLKSTVLTMGQGSDGFGHNDAWILA